MHTIRREHMAALATASSSKFADAMMPHLRARWPERFGDTPAATIAAWVRDAVARAGRLGFFSERHVNLSIELELELVTRTGSSELPADAAAVLSDADRDPDERLFAALFLVRSR